MEIKDYSVVASNIEKANALLNETRTIVKKEVNGIVGNAMSKMGKWFFETCFPCTKTPDTIMFSESWRSDKFTLNLSYSYGDVDIDIKDGRFEVGEGSSGFCYRIPGQRNTNHGKGYFTSVSQLGSYWMDEETILNVVNHWSEIKTEIEKYVKRIFDIAKDDAIKKAAEIQRSIEVSNLLKDFEA